MRTPSGVVGVGLILLMVSVVHAAPGDPLGPDFQVNTYTTGNEAVFFNQAVAPDGIGGFVVVWRSAGSSGTDQSTFSIQGQRFDGVGLPVGGEFQVNSYTTGDQGQAAVAPIGSGNFVVVWRSSEGDGTDPIGSVQGQRFDASGTPLGGQFQVNSYTSAGQDTPVAAPVGTAGGFVVVWRSDGSQTDTSGHSIQAQLFDGDAMPVGGEFQVNTYTTGAQDSPAILGLGDGGFVVVWSGYGNGSDTSDTSIQMRRFDLAGTPAGSESQVNTYTTDYQANPGIGADGSGGFVIAWDSGGSGGTDTDGASAQARRFDAAGAPLGGDFQVNTYTAGDQFGYSAAPDGAGGFVVVWASYGNTGNDPSSRSINGKRFDAAGAAVGDDFQVNSYTTGSQDSPTVVPDPAGGFVVAWESNGSAGTDTIGLSVQARRFEGGVTTTTTPGATSTSTTLGTTTTTTLGTTTTSTTLGTTSTTTPGATTTTTTLGTTSTTTPGPATTTTTTPDPVTTTTTTLAPGQALPGRKLALTTKPGHPEKSKLALLAKDALTIGDGNDSADDPVVHGGTLTIASSAGGFATTHPLVGGWRYVGKVGEGRGYKWKSRTAPIRSVVVKSTKLAIAGQGAGLGFDLDDDPNPVRVVLAIGTQTYCLELGGEARFKAGKLFRAKGAPAPALCP
jgi:hypothetical protein